MTRAGARRRAGEDTPVRGFDEYVLRRGPLLVALARVLLRRPDAAPDVVVAALARVLPRWDRPGEEEDPEVLTVRAVVHACTSWRPPRRSGSASPEADPQADPDEDPQVGREAPPDVDPQAWRAPARTGTAPAGGAARDGSHEALLARVRHLPAPQRAVLALRHVTGLDDQQIAEVLEEDPATVAQRAERAMAALHRARP